jgi:probable HAF family extracellular repeat protein
MFYGDSHSYEESAKERMERGTRMMEAKANLLRTLLVLAAGLLAVAVALFGVGLRTAEPQTTAPSYYKVQDLGTLPGATYSPPTSEPSGINDSGHVVGYAALSSFPYCEWGYCSEYVVGHAFLYDGAMKDLGEGGFTSSATDINNSGHVVANFVDGNWVSHAYLYKDGKMTDLGLGGPDSQAYGINDSDQVVGESQVAGTDNYHAFLYDERATPKMKDLGLLGGTYRSYYSNSQAMAINNKGQVVGFSAYTDSNHIHAFLYDSAHGMKDLGDFSDLGGTNSYGWGINNEGQVVGMAQDVDGGEWHAFLYDKSATPMMKDLGTLGGTNSSAYAINDSGQVVGAAHTSSGEWHAFLYQNEKMIDLGTRTHPDQNGNVWTLDTARGINNNGQIIVSGSRVDQNGRDVNSALLLTPISDTPPGDSQPPSAPSISSPQNNSYDKDGSFSVSGTAEASSTVELFEGTTSRGTTKADPSSGAWSIDLSGVSEGAHTYKARATDAAGNSSSASNSVTVKVDTSSPETNIASGPSGPTNDNTPTFSFSASDNLSEAWYLRYSYKVDGGAWSSYSSETSVTLGGVSGLSEGSHTFYAKARDEAGNEDQSPAQRSFTVDTTQPMVNGTTPSVVTGVGRGTDLTASFSEKMETSTVNTTTFKLYKVNTDGTQTQITDVEVSLSSDGLKATLNPFGGKTTLLANRTKYKGVISTGTKDLAGNPLAQQKSWTFTTKS